MCSSTSAAPCVIDDEDNSGGDHDNDDSGKEEDRQAFRGPLVMLNNHTCNMHLRRKFQVDIRQLDTRLVGLTVTWDHNK